jgi:hypothetical protein
MVGSTDVFSFVGVCVSSQTKGTSKTAQGDRFISEAMNLPLEEVTLSGQGCQVTSTQGDSFTIDASSTLE